MAKPMKTTKYITLYSGTGTHSPTGEYGLYSTCKQTEITLTLTCQVPGKKEKKRSQSISEQDIRA